jgi:hypothetical protein
VTLTPVLNPLSENYVIGHKLSALALLTGSGLGLFLDTDILAMAAPEPLLNLTGVVPASFHHCSDLVWRYLYCQFGLPFPQTAPPTLVSREQVAPYFNSGMIVVPGGLASRVAAEWVETSRLIDADIVVPPAVKRPWLDQVAFPIATAKLRLQMQILEQRWNFPGWPCSIRESPTPIFFHYHRLHLLARERVTVEAADRAMALSPVLRNALAEWLHAQADGVQRAQRDG